MPVLRTYSEYLTHVFAGRKEAVHQLLSKKSTAGRDPDAQLHSDNFTAAYFSIVEYFSLIHQPVPLAETKRNPEAKKALDKEWTKLWNMKIQNEQNKASKIVNCF